MSTIKANTARITTDVLGVGSIQTNVASITDTTVSVGPTTVNTSQIQVGNVIFAPPLITTPGFFIGSQDVASLKGIINYSEFTANGTWYNPYSNASVNSTMTGSEGVLVLMWGGGGGGSANGSAGTTGGGGAFNAGVFQVSSLPSTVTVTVGVGGASSVVASGDTSTTRSGGNSIFDRLVAYGGAGLSTNANQLNSSTLVGGGGGGTISAGSLVTGGGPTDKASNIHSFYGGGIGNDSEGLRTGYPSIFGGGGGGGGAGAMDGQGGWSIYGGAGGSDYYPNGSPLPVATSIFGGNGGNPTTAGSIPGGGGGASLSTATAGARGEVRVWVMSGS